MTSELWTIHRMVLAKDYKGLKNTLKPHWNWLKLSGPQSRAGSTESPSTGASISDIDYNASIVKTTWCDPAHPEPWVYAEIHNVFFNAVCDY
jgi:hypothetical protein